MLGILFLYYIGKQFYDLAIKHEKNKWLFAILSIIVYYASSFVGGVIVAILGQTVFHYSVDDMQDIVIGLMALPFAFFCVWLFYYLLKKQWEKETLFNDENILDSDIYINK